MSVCTSNGCTSTRCDCFYTHTHTHISAGTKFIGTWRICQSRTYYASRLPLTDVECLCVVSLFHDKLLLRISRVLTSLHKIFHTHTWMRVLAFANIYKIQKSLFIRHTDNVELNQWLHTNARMHVLSALLLLLLDICEFRFMAHLNCKRFSKQNQRQNDERMRERAREKKMSHSNRAHFCAFRRHVCMSEMSFDADVHLSRVGFWQINRKWHVKTTTTKLHAKVIFPCLFGFALCFFFAFVCFWWQHIIHHHSFVIEKVVWTFSMGSALEEVCGKVIASGCRFLTMSI